VRTVSAATTTAWNAAIKTGTANRPMLRATIERLQIGLVPYDNSTIPTRISGSTVTSLPQKTNGSYATAQFCWNEAPVELPNIKSMSWTRSIDQDIATATLVLWNTATLPLGTAPTDSYAFDIPGALSFNRGTTSESQSRWGQSSNGWKNLIAPDRVIRTFEGYGFNASVPPDHDTNLYPSGVWLIDTVEYTSTGLITIGMRDLGRLLSDHTCFPPVIPESEYPLSFSRYAKQTAPIVYKTTGGWFRPSYHDDSNRYWYRAGVKGVTSSGTVDGHNGNHAFDGSTATYWMSLNNAVTHGHGWVEGSFSARTVGAVKVKPWNGPYSLFISVYANGKWQGKDLVPTHTGDPNIGEAIPIVYHAQCNKNTETVFQLWRSYPGATRVRVSVIHDGTYGGDGQHVGIYDVQVSDAVTTSSGGGTYYTGNYGDFSEIVRKFCAWGGFFWPRTTGANFNRLTSTDGSQVVISPLTDDPIFPQGRVWGDFEALADETPVLTPSGWTTHGALLPGDWVYGADGRRKRVVGVTGSVEQECFLVEFDRGEAIVANGGHLWSGLRHAGGRWRKTTYTTRELAKFKKPRFVVPLTHPLNFPTMHQEIPAYVLGLWLGDGDSDKGRITGPAYPEVFTYIENEGEKLGIPNKDSKKLRRTILGMRGRLDRLGLLGNKHIPDKYLYGGVSQRMALIQGLMDSDGTVRNTGSASFANKDKKLVEQIEFLLSSLGQKYTTITTRRKGETYYLIEFRPTVRDVFRVRAKLDKVILASELSQQAVSASGRRIRSVTPIGVRSAQCIEVEGDGLYLAGQDLVVTHNSTGTGGIVDFTVDQFDKKPLLDCLAVVRDIVSYNFFIDEQGGVIWRSPNIWSVGNYLSNQNGGPNLGRTTTVVEIPDDETMMSLAVTLNSANVRERTFIASTSGNVGGVAAGIFSDISGPFQSGMRRVGGYTDQNFATSQECQIMADLITVRSMFTYRTTQVTIPGYPAIQIDDQVRLYERTTSETYLHYVKGIQSNFDMQTGKWTYQLSTHWLGESPFQKWVFDPSQLSAETQAYLRAIGKI
jgi:LAGLIDADG-like domain